MNDKKPWYLSRTIWLAVVTLIIGLLQLVSDSSLFGEQTNAYIIIVMGIATAVMRFLTDKPIIEK